MTGRGYPGHTGDDFWTAADLSRARAMIASGEGREMRERLRLSQGDLAAELGVTSGAVAHWEAGRRMPLAKMACKYVGTLESLTAAAKERRRVRGPSLTELDRRGDEFASDVVDAISAVMKELLDQSGDSLDADDLAALPVLWSAVAEDKLLPHVERAWVDSATSIRDQVEKVEAKALTAAAPVPMTMAELYLAEALNRIVAISDVIWEFARAELLAGLAAEESVQEITERLLVAVPLLAEPQASVIARTEINGAANAGSHAEMEAIGLPYTKTWIATSDSRTRDSHEHADGQTVDSTEKFSVGGHPMDYPHDPRGPAEEVVNCRCTASYELAEEDVIQQVLAQRAVTAAAGVMDGAMIALVPTDQDAKKLAVEGGDPAGQLHITLAYLGKADELNENQRMIAHQLAEDLAEEMSISEVSVAGYGTLGEDGAVVLFLNSVPLADAHASLVNDDDFVDSYPEQHQPWIPHLTLGYGLDPSVAAQFVGTSFDVDRVRVAIGGESDDLNVYRTYALPNGDTVVAASEGGAMPWSKVKGHADCGDDKPWAVVKDDDGSVEGCHATESEADEQIAALYASEEDGAVTETAGGKPSKGTKKDKRLKKNKADGETEAMTDAQRKLAELRSRVLGTELAAEVVTEAGNRQPWIGVLTVEGVRTGDGREFAENALGWADLPIPLRWMKEGAHGGDHDVTVNVGNIENIWRDGNKIMGAGFIDTDNEDGAEIHRRLDNDYPGGISIDADDITEADIEFVWPEDDTEGEEDDGDVLTLLFAAPEAMIFHAGRIRAATLVDIPAFVEASIKLASAEEVAEVLAAVEPEAAEALVASGVGYAPAPAAWFQNPKLSVPTGITVGEPNADGWRRVYGHAAQWGECHIGHPDVCITLPQEDSHDWFMTGEVPTDDGGTAAVGQITLATGHAPLSYGASKAVEHYDHTGACVADVAVGNDGHGLWVAGAIRPDVDEKRVHQLRASGRVSGDWRKIGGKLRLVGLLGVNVAGFPIPRTRARVASGAISEDATVEALVAAGQLTIGTHGVSEEQVEALARRKMMELLGQRVHAK